MFIFERGRLGVNHGPGSGAMLSRMLDLEQTVARDYAHGALEQAILDALAKAGKDLDRLEPGDLAPVDEFHIGGRRATAELAEELQVPAGAHLLDIGCGLGGASRYFAHEHACRVTGLDLTAEFIRTATALARRVRLGDRVSYRVGNASDLPFPAGTFDGAYMLHVGMNIADKAAVFAGVRRVLKPGAMFGVYDVMQEQPGGLGFPTPWATTAATSFVEPAATYRRLLQQTGFEILKERSRRAFALDTFKQMRARAVQAVPPPLGLHIVMGPSAPQKVANMMAGVERGLIAPTEMIARAA
jgi:ubiquinone/menaquinone biosynthesis C-methylase UbiE